MVKRLLHLYHSRLTSELRFLLPAIFLLILLINLASKSSFDVAKDRVLDDPSNPALHLALGDLLLKDNQLTNAFDEFNKGRDYSRQAEVLRLQAEPEDLQNQIIFWQKVTEQFPAFRDAYLKLAILNYKLRRSFDAKKFLDKALEIDPNNEVARKLVSLL